MCSTRSNRGRVELRLVRLHRRDLLLDRVGDVHDELAVPVPLLGVERERDVDQVRHAVRGGAVEPLVPLGELRVEPGRLADQVALVGGPGDAAGVRPGGER